MAWLDNAGLYRKYGTEQTVAQKGGEYVTVGATRVIEFVLDVTALGTDPAICPGTDNLVLPAGVFIEEVEVINNGVALTGTNAVLNIGLIKTDRTNAIDVDGVLKVAPRTDFASAGSKKTYTVGVTGAGDLVGLSSGAFPAHFTADYDTAAFAGGTVTIRVKYRKP